MNASDLNPQHKVRDVRVTDARLFVDLEDGRTISVPIEWYPRLEKGTPEQRANWQTVGAGWGLEAFCLPPLGTEVQLRHPALDFPLIDLISAQLQHHADVPQMTVRSRVSIVLELPDDYVLGWGEGYGALIEFEVSPPVERPSVKRVGPADV